MSTGEHQDRYLSAAHAMQSGVASKMTYEPAETEPKHLRVGVNSAMVSVSALVYLLVSKGLITEEEWFEMLANQMEAERDSYAAWLSERLGPDTKITLG